MENKIEFHTQTNQIQDSWVMRITSDRRIEVNEDVEVTEAAKKVLEAMQLLLTPQRKPLTTDQMYSAIRPLFKTDALAEAALSLSFAEYRAIEAAHGIKENT